MHCALYTYVWALCSNKSLTHCLWHCRWEDTRCSHSQTACLGLWHTCLACESAHQPDTCSVVAAKGCSSGCLLWLCRQGIITSMHTPRTCHAVVTGRTTLAAAAGAPERSLHCFTNAARQATNAQVFCPLTHTSRLHSCAWGVSRKVCQHGV